MSKRCLFLLCLIGTPLVSLSCRQAQPLSDSAGNPGQTGIEAKKPVFGGACVICPWGAMAEVVKEAVDC